MKISKDCQFNEHVFAETPAPGEPCNCGYKQWTWPTSYAEWIKLKNETRAKKLRATFSLVNNHKEDEVLQ